MPDTPDSVVLVHVRPSDEKVDRLSGALQDFDIRVIGVEKRPDLTEANR